MHDKKEKSKSFHSVDVNPINRKIFDCEHDQSALMKIVEFKPLIRYFCFKLTPFRFGFGYDHRFDLSYTAAIGGLLSACKKWDESKLPFKNFACVCMARSIQNYWACRSARFELERLSGKYVSLAEISESKSGKTFDVFEFEEIERSDKIVSLVSWMMDVIEADNPNDAKCFRHYYGLDGKRLNHREIAERYGISKQRVCQRIEKAKRLFLGIIKNNPALFEFADFYPDLGKIDGELRIIKDEAQRKSRQAIERRSRKREEKRGRGDELVDG